MSNKAKDGLIMNINKLVIARHSIDSATKFAELILKHCESEKDELYIPLHSAMVVAYGRVFAESRSAGPLTVYAKWKTAKTDEGHRIHDSLMKQRNKDVAHADNITDKVDIVEAEDDKNIFIRQDVLVNVLPISDIEPVARYTSDLSEEMSRKLNSYFEKQKFGR